MQRAHVLIHGKVIMVGFRFFIRNKALSLDVECFNSEISKREISHLSNGAQNTYYEWH